MAPSTPATMARGVETATSMPHASVNSHSFLKSLTRATTRATPNSALANNAAARFTLSSPVAAMTTSHSCSPDSWSDASSHASASNHSASGTVCGT